MVKIFLQRAKQRRGSLQQPLLSGNVAGPTECSLVGPGDVVGREGAIGQDLRESWPKEMCLNTFMTRSLSPSLTLRVTPAPAAIAMGTSGSPPPLRLSLVFATASDFFPVGPGVLLRASLWVGVAEWWTPPPAMTVARAASKRKPARGGRRGVTSPFSSAHWRIAGKSGQMGGTRRHHD